jgi:hypothetical protein
MRQPDDETMHAVTNHFTLHNFVRRLMVPAGDRHGRRFSLRVRKTMRITATIAANPDAAMIATASHGQRSFQSDSIIGIIRASFSA